MYLSGHLSHIIKILSKIIMPPKTFKKRFNAKRKTAPKTGLNKTEKSQVVKLARKAVEKEAEAKFFNTARVVGVRPLESNQPSRVSVLAFSTSLSNLPNSSVQLTYGVDTNGAEQPITELKMLRPFVPVTGTAQTDAYHIVGRECRPRS